ncbi:xanthine dehydrogenase family protein molybdopterin-binding subunit [Treponema sp. OMZ 840]|uniref:xanthine dehydrogenase family protein molybdopterin-binding subunit n=1 Tax=Treponema sp. OMZ 840 TaxID=244313 RepID=UPI003D8FC1CA
MKSKNIKQNKTKTIEIHRSPVFYSDKQDEHLLYAVLVRSPVSDGTIRDIRHSSLPEGYRLFTAKDIPGENKIHTFNTEFPLLAAETISYEGEPIGILTGPDYIQLNQLLAELEITYTRSFPDKNKTDKEIAASRRYSFGNFDKAWSTSQFKSDKTYKLNVRFPSHTETDGAFCRFQNNELTVYTPSRWPSHLYHNMCSVLNIDKSRIQLYKTPSSSAKTNAPWHNSVLSIQCALAAILTEAPVLLSLSRREQLLYIDNPLPVTIRHKTALNEQGSITAASVRIEIDAGAFNPFISAILDRLAVSCISIYKPQNLIVEGFAYRSRTAPGTASMQWADYHGFYAIESQIQELSRISNLNSVDVRLKNIFDTHKTRHSFPFKFETSPIHDVIHDVIKRSDFYRKYASYKLTGLQSHYLFSTVPIRGIGFSCAYEGNGFLGTEVNSLRQSLEVSMEKDGSAVIYAQASSATVSSIWKNIAADLLSIPTKSIVIDSCNSHSEENDLPETIISNISIMTQLLKKCCEAIQKLRFRQPLPIRVKRSLAPGKKNMWNYDDFCGTPFYTTSWAAAAAEVELNPKTYTYTVRNIWVTIDGGTILYDSKAESVIQQCIKRLFSCSEEFQTNPIPTVFINFIPGESEPKQIGELIFNVLPAAIGSAVSQALGYRIADFPIGPETIYTHIHKTLDEHQKEQPDANPVKN